MQSKTKIEMCFFRGGFSFSFPFPYPLPLPLHVFRCELERKIGFRQVGFGVAWEIVFFKANTLAPSAKWIKFDREKSPSLMGRKGRVGKGGEAG